MTHFKTDITWTTAHTSTVFWAPGDPKNLSIEQIVKIRARKSRICEWMLEWYINIPTSSAEMDAIRQLSNAFIGGMIGYPLTLDEKSHLKCVLLGIKEQRIPIPINYSERTTIQTMFGKTIGAISLEEAIAMTPEEEDYMF